MAEIKNLLHSRHLLFVLSLAAGMIADRGALWTMPLVLPALALVMTLSTLGIPNDVFRAPRALLPQALLGTVMSYVVLGNFIIALSAVLIREEALWTGFVIMAAVPPAIAVAPFANYLEGNVSHARTGTAGAYLGALIIMPLIAFGLLGTSFVDPYRLAVVMLGLIVLPLLISRLIIAKGWSERLEPLKSRLTDWCFFLVMYTIVGMNRGLLLQRPSILLLVIVVAFASTFLLGVIIEWVGGLFRINRETLTRLVLFGTLKNYSLAGGIALYLFEPEMALPAAVATVFMLIYIVWLGYRK
jgi:BASS family bile acid:Na+ symporter